MTVDQLRDILIRISDAGLGDINLWIRHEDAIEYYKINDVHAELNFDSNNNPNGLLVELRIE